MKIISAYINCMRGIHIDRVQIIKISLTISENIGHAICRANLTLQKKRFFKFCAVKPNPTFAFIASEAHWLCWVDGVEASAPVATVTSSNATSASLHARRATVKRVAASHAVVMVAINKVVAPPIPTICREREKRTMIRQ